MALIHFRLPRPLAGQTDSAWSRKLKVPLAGITGTMLAAGGILETCVPGTGRDGGPACATIQDFDGWRCRGKPTLRDSPVPTARSSCGTSP
jgi:hypothetical protein